MPQASARRLPFGHPRICSQITGDSALQCWSGCEISPRVHHFYSRPCGRGDWAGEFTVAGEVRFLLTPLREGRQKFLHQLEAQCDFYSRPCGRGDLRDFPVFHVGIAISTHAPAGGATIGPHSFRKVYAVISTHAPAGGATPVSHTEGEAIALFLLTPLREGRLELDVLALCLVDFYSRPCGRGDPAGSLRSRCWTISTHAPAGGATAVGLPLASTALFLLTPLREGRRSRRRTIRNRNIFLLTPLREGRQLVASQARENVMRFLLTPLREGRRARGWTWTRRSSYFYSRPCGRGDVLDPVQHKAHDISTHAPAGGATRPSGAAAQPRQISTHAPAGGATRRSLRLSPGWSRFLLTPLREGRRSYRSGECGGAGNFYSRPCGRGDQGRRRYAARRRHFYSRPCGRGDFHAVLLSRADQISTHAPAGGATLAAEDGYDGQHISTHAPAGGATCVRAFSFCGNRIISTHAPAGGATRQQASKRLFSALYFYSRPCGRGDYHDVRFSKKAARFLLTPLREGRRHHAHDGRYNLHISTHAPAGGATKVTVAESYTISQFLLTPLREGRPLDSSASSLRSISTHAPAGGATFESAITGVAKTFLLTPLREGRRAGFSGVILEVDFYSRPCGRGDAGESRRRRRKLYISTHAPAGGAT